MNPHIFGRGSWIIIFQIFFFFIKNLILKKSYVKNIKNNDKPTEERLNNLNKFNPNYHYFILNNTESDIITKIYKTDTENLKKKLLDIISSLPCNDCKIHCLSNINKNKILEEENIYVIFHFFIELRNIFYSKKIDRTLFDTESDILSKENYLFETVIKN